MQAFQHKTAQRTYESVLLAIYGLADAEGLLCKASNAELAKASGRAVDTVKSCLARMESSGDIFMLRPAGGGPMRSIVLLDNPNSGRVIARFLVKQRLGACGSCA